MTKRERATEKDYSKLFIAFEGPSASGRSTQTALLARHFAALPGGYDLLVVHEPPKSHEYVQPALEIVHTQTDPYFGGNKRMIEEVFLRFARVREETSQDRIRPHLIQGGIAIADGYEGHGVIQAVQGYSKGLIVKRNIMMEEPDITFVLDIPGRVQQRRLRALGEPRDVFERHPDFQKQVRKGYQHLNQLFDDGKNVILLNGTQNQQTLHERVVAAIERFVAKRSS